MVKEDSGFETYALPIPYRRSYGKVGEQWWAGMSPAEARAGPRAGPFASSSEVKQAAREVKDKERSRLRSSNAKNAIVNIERQDVREGLRRQILHLPMEGVISPEAEQEAMAKYGKEWQQVLQELEEEEMKPSNVCITQNKQKKHAGRSPKTQTNVKKSVGASTEDSSNVYLDDDDEDYDSDDFPEWEDPTDRNYTP